jgi:hypothetical protein
MLECPKIIKVQTYNDRKIEVHFENGLKAFFNFENYYDYSGYYSFLKDITIFLKIFINQKSNYIFWLDKTGQEIEIDSTILYSICSQEKIMVNEEIVFDPSLGKNSWLDS